MTGEQDQVRALLRHTLATLAYRGGKVVRGAPAGFESFRAGATSRSAGEILAHIGDLLEWAVRSCQGDQSWHESPPRAWDEETERLFNGLRALDAFLASDAPLTFPAERLFQGPIADSLTHVGQLALLRRLAGKPVRGENYFAAEIATGRVGIQQAPPVHEFD